VTNISGALVSIHACEISGSHGSLLRYRAVSSPSSRPTFKKCVLPTSSGRIALHTSQTSVYFNHTTPCYIPKPSICSFLFLPFLLDGHVSSCSRCMVIGSDSNTNLSLASLNYVFVVNSCIAITHQLKSAWTWVVRTYQHTLVWMRKHLDAFRGPPDVIHSPPLDGWTACRAAHDFWWIGQTSWWKGGQARLSVEPPFFPPRINSHPKLPCWFGFTCFPKIVLASQWFLSSRQQSSNPTASFQVYWDTFPGTWREAVTCGICHESRVVCIQC
jgi:hypothetical protein